MAEDTASSTSSSSNDSCQDLTVDEAKQMITPQSAVATVESAACIITILLIVALRAYRKYVHRLSLYLAIVNLALSTSVGLGVITVDTGKAGNTTVSVKDGWNDVCIVLAYFVQYSSTACTFVMSWVCLYVFVLAVFNVQLKERSHELGGVLITAFVFPALFSWELFIGQNYGLSSVFCWIKTSCNSSTDLGVVFLLGFNGLQALMGILSLLSILVVAAMFCRRALNHSSYLQHQHWKALKEVLPLLIYPTLFSLVSVAGIVQTLDYVIVGGDHSYLGQLITFPVLMIALLLSFLLHPHIQSQLRCRISTNTKASTVEAITHHQTQAPTITTSQTCHIVSRDSLCTEGDPLIIKQ